MPYDLTDPQQADIVRQKALARGLKSEDIERAIRKATQQQYARQLGYSPTGKINEPSNGYDEYSKMLDIKKKELDIGSLVKEQEEADKPDESKIQTIGVVDELLGRNTKPITGLLQIGARIPGNEAQRTKALYNQLKGLLSLENREQLKGSGSISDFEAGLLADAAAALDRNMSDSDFRAELEKVKSILTKQTGVEPAPGLDIGQKKNIPQPVEKNISGQIAGVGDLVRDDTGKLKIQGTFEDDPLFKTNTQLGFQVDNSLIRFLADSEFLPIAGSITGGLSGGLVGGAGGAMLGKAGQQALKELLDPEAQNLSDMSQAILVEGLTDAVFSGLTLGIGKVGGKALGLVLSKPGEEVVEQAGKQLAKETTEGISKEALEAGGKRLPLIGSQEELLRKAYPQSLSVKTDFQKKYGTSLYTKVIEFLDGDLSKLTNPESAADIAKAGKKTAGKEISEKIAGRAVDADLVIPKIEEIIEGVKKPLVTGGEKKTTQGVVDLSSLTKSKKMVVPSEYSAGVKRLEEKISFLKSFAKENNGYIPLEEVQLMKQELSDAFRGVAEEKTAKKLVQKGYGSLMGVIEKYGGEGIKESNLKYYVFDLLSDSAVKADEKVVRAAFDAMDIIAAGSGTAASGGNLAVGGATAVLTKFLRSLGKDPFVQLKVVNKLGSYAVEKGNKNALRALILSAGKLGHPIGINQTLIKELGKESFKAVTQPGLNLQPEPSESSLGLDLGQGGGYPQRHMYR